MDFFNFDGNENIKIILMNEIKKEHLMSFSFKAMGVLLAIIGFLVITIYGFTYKDTIKSIEKTRIAIEELKKYNYNTNTILTRMTVVLENSNKQDTRFESEIKDLQTSIKNLQKRARDLEKDILIINRSK